MARLVKQDMMATITQTVTLCNHGEQKSKSESTNVKHWSGRVTPSEHHAGRGRGSPNLDCCSCRWVKAVNKSYFLSATAVFKIYLFIYIRYMFVPITLPSSSSFRNSVGRKHSRRCGFKHFCSSTPSAHSKTSDVLRPRPLRVCEVKHVTICAVLL